MEHHPVLAETRKKQSSNSGIGEAHPALSNLDPSTSFLYRPRTVTFGALGKAHMVVLLDCVADAPASAQE